MLILYNIIFSVSFIKQRFVQITAMMPGGYGLKWYFKMGLFEYLGVLISVVMGLGITHLLVGINKIIQYRNYIQIYWVQVIWSINILVYILVIWWGFFGGALLRNGHFTNFFLWPYMPLSCFYWPRCFSQGKSLVILILKRTF